jgi:hypothetical protein
MNKHIKLNLNYFIIIVFALICFQFLWLQPFSMKWDLAEQYLPWRYFLGKSLQNGEIPFWNSFQLGGYPTFADPQSGFWYYPIWIVGYLFGYSMKIIELEILTLVITAGIGFYKLNIKLGNSKQASLLVSMAYMCSGFIIGNAQHLTWIAAAAWIPWLFYHYNYIREEKINYHLIWFLIILYLFASSSYPAFIIVSAYLIGIDQLTLFFKSKEKSKFILNGIVLVILCIIILSPIIYSLISSKAYFSRGAGLTLAKALQHPFTWQSLLSFVAPFASFKNPSLFNTDISMSNAYIGIVPFVLLITSLLFIKKLKKERSWLIWAFIFILIGFGDQTPIRKFLFDYIPGFNLFRFPALFRLFAIGYLLLYVGSVYGRFEDVAKKSLWIITTLVILFSAYIYLNINSWHPFHLNSLSALAKQFESTTFTQHLLFQYTISGILLILFALIVIKKMPRYLIIIVCVLDLFINVRINAMATMVLDTKTSAVDSLLINAPQQFHTPKQQALISSIDQQYEYRWPLNWNMNCYFGEIAIDGYNPFVLNTFNSLSESPLKDSIWKNAWFSFPTALLESDTPTLVSSNTSWKYNSNNNTRKIYTGVVKVNTISYSPRQFNLNYSSTDTALLVFAQNPYAGWMARIDNESQTIQTVNYAQQLVVLTPGTHQVTWEFNNIYLNWILILHVILFCMLFVYASYQSIVKHYYI